MGKIRSEAIPAAQEGGATALAVIVTGVATELPLFGAVIVMIPFDVEAEANEAKTKSASTTDFIETPRWKRCLSLSLCEVANAAACPDNFGKKGEEREITFRRKLSWTMLESSNSFRNTGNSVRRDRGLRCQCLPVKGFDQG